MISLTFRIVLVGVSAAIISADASAGETPAPKDARVYFENLKNGAVVTSPLTVKFGISGMALAPAGTDAPNTGHHHLIIDEPPVTGNDLVYAIPADEHHKHFGKAQAEASITLPKGEHTLQLLLGDANHIAHNPPVMSERITITVQ